LIITRLTGLCAALAICTTLATTAGAQTANPFKKPAPAEAAAAATAADKAKAAPATKPSATKPSATEAIAEKRPPSQAQLASRAHMKECGADWQEMKAAGTTKGKTWRQFSGECLKKKSM
jgi:hypothetical protein